MNHPNTPDLPRLPRDPDPLARFRARWNIDTARDGIHIWSALRKPSPSSLIYVVAHSRVELALRLSEIEVGQRDRVDDLADSYQPPEDDQ